MSVQIKLATLIDNIINSINNLNSYIGDLGTLPTTDKTSIVNSLIELKSTIDDKAVINDASVTLSETWSSDKIVDEISQGILDLIDGAPAVLDTLKELATALQNNPDVITDLVNMVGDKENTIAVGSVNEFYAWDKTMKPITKSMVGLGNLTNDAQIRLSDLDTDNTLSANSDSKVPSQKAVKSALETKQAILTNASDIDVNIIDAVRVNTDLLVVDGHDILAAVDGILDVQQETSEPTGFINRTDSSISFDNLTRTFSIITTTGYDYFIKGLKYNISTDKSITIPDVDGSYFFYLDVTKTLSYVTAFDTTLLRDYVFIASVNWSTTQSKILGLAEERHGTTMDWATHSYLHNYVGARIRPTDFTIGNFVLNGNGSNDTHCQASFGNGTLTDEDINSVITNSATPTLPFEQILSPLAELPIMHKIGSSLWYLDDATPNLVKEGTSRIQYNSFSGTWSSVDVANTKYVAMWVFATNFMDSPIRILLGQREDLTLNDAIANNTYEALNLTGLEIQEYKILYRLIFQADDSYTNTLKARLVQVTDLRKSIDQGQLVTTSTNNHSLLINLTSDDHTHYHNDARGDARYYTQTELDSGSLDTRYYTESEITTLLTGKANSSHTHVSADITDLSPTTVGLGNVTNIDTTNASNISTGTLANTRLTANLTDIGGLSFTSGDLIQYNGTNLVNVTVNDIKTDLALVKGDVGLGNVANVDTTDASNISTGTLSNGRLTANLLQLGGITFATNDIMYYNGSILTNITPSGYKSLLSLTKSDVGLGNVTNFDTTNATNISTGTLANARLTTNLTQLGGITFATNDFIQYNGSTLVKVTPSSVKTSLAITKSDIGLGNVANVDTTNASNITTGTLPLSVIPVGALDRLSIVADQTARFALTTATVQNGDTVKQNDTGLMYYVIDDTNLDSALGYEIYTAGSATSVPYSGITSLPSNISQLSSITFSTNDLAYYNGSILTNISPTSYKALLSLTKSDVGLNNLTNSLQVINSGGVVSYASGNNSAKPTAGTANRFYAATDIGVVYRDNGATWDAQLPAYTGDVTSTFGNSVLTLATVNSNVGTFNNVTVNAKGLVTAASNVSYLTGNQTITASGDITGSGTTSIALTLATVNSNVGTFGSTTVVPVITTNAKGLITSVSTAALTNASVGLGNVSNNLQVINSGGVVSYASGNNASKPTAGTANRFYAATDIGVVYRDNGVTWDAQLPAYTGDVTSTFGNSVLTLATVNSNVGTFNNVTVNGKGLVTSASNVSYLTGNQTITVSGDITGSGTTTLSLTLPNVNSNVGTFNNVNVNAKGQVIAATNVAYITGNQSITLSGDFSGTGTTSISGTLATVNSNVGSFGSTTVVPVITVNGKGLVTAVSSANLTSSSVGLGNVSNSLQVINAGGAVSYAIGTNASRPTFGTVGRQYYSTDLGITFYDTGTSWVAKLPAYTGDVTSSVNGTALTLATVNSNVGTFNNVTVNGKGLVTAASNVSYLTGNQSITLSGDFSGTGTTSISGTLATVNSNVGTFGSTTVVPVVTVNGKGLVTAVSTAALTNASVGLGNVANSLQVINTGNVVSIASGLNSVKPVAGTVNRFYASTDIGVVYRDNGTTWDAQLPAYTGDVSSTFGNTTLTLATVNSNVGTFNNVTVNAKGLVTAASNVSYLTGNESITLSGDFSGTGTTSISGTLATVNSNIGTFNNLTVNAKGLVTAASNVSYLTGNESITVTGDITGSGSTSIALTLATVNSNVGTFGSTTVVPVITANAKGLITSVTTAALTNASVGLGNVSNNLQVINSGGVISYASGNNASKPTAGTINRFYASTDIGVVYRDNGTTWDAQLPAYTGDVTSTFGNSVLTLATVNSNVGTFNNVTVNAKGLVTAASNVAYITGNQTITVTGDITGSGTTSIALTLATVNSNVGTFNNVTVNGKGLVTAASNVSYLTGNQSITLSGDFSGTGTTSISGTLATVNSNVGTFNNVTVNGKGLVTAASNISYLTGNESITLSGDFSGTGTTSISGTLATVNSNVGTFGSTTVVPVVTVNGKGLVTAVSTAALTNASVGLGNVANSLQVINTGNVVSIASGLDSAKPVAGTLGRYYNSTDIGGIYRDNGVAWQLQSIAYTGDVTSSVNGTVLTLATVNSNVGTFNNVTVNGKGLVTAASNVAYITGNQTITVSGDITGSGTTSIGLTLATVNSNVGTFGSTTVVPVITTNAKGLITAVSSANLTNASVGLGNVSNNLQVINAGNGVSFASGTLAARPVAATNGRLYATTNDGIYLDNGASWILQSPAYTGDVTKSANATALTLATVNSNVGTFNNVTINAKGLATSASNVDYLLDPAANGIVVRTAINTTTNRTLTGTANQTSITNGDGVAGNPTIAIASNPVLPGTASTTIPIGTTAERDTATNGQLRFNSTLGYAETSSNNVYHPLGKVVQFISSDIIQTTGTTILPYDATLPTSTEGFQIWTANITPTYTTSTIVVIFNVYAECSAGTATATLALYNGTTAISITAGRGVNANTAMNLSISKRFVSGTISPITLSARIGPSAAATVYVNRGNTETFGGTTNSSYIIMEII